MKVKKARLGRPLKYPFSDMRVGEEVFFADQPEGSQASVAVSARRYGHRHKRVYTAQAKDGGVLIWRVK